IIQRSTALRMDSAPSGTAGRPAQALRRASAHTTKGTARGRMRILIGYLIRAHVGPFLFALTALTGLLFVNAIAQRLQDLMGKGLTRDVVLEFMLFSIPHTIALTLPMAVLVSVLYAFSDLAASNEITA